MEQFLKDHLKTNSEFAEDWTNWQYSEDVNTDALSDDWLENRTSYIYRVGVLCAIDANKCDWVHIAIGTQRVIDRAFKLIQYTHPAFDVDKCNTTNDKHCTESEQKAMQNANR